MSRSKLAGYLALGWPPHALAYVVAPNLLAATTKHLGATVGLGPWSIAGLPFIAAGAFMIVWAMVTHYRTSPDELRFALPVYLATTGAYAVSRNPFYFGGALLWTGWAVAWLSLAVLGVGILFFGFFATIGIPYEERKLHALHGATYDDYRNTVPRWFGRRRRSITSR